MTISRVGQWGQSSARSSSLFEQSDFFTGVLLLPRGPRGRLPKVSTRGVAKKGLGGTGHEVSVMSGPVIGPLLRSPPLPHVQCGRALVEHYGLGVLVCHLGHMTEDIFFCDNTKEASAERERGGEEDRQRKR